MHGTGQGHGRGVSGGGGPSSPASELPEQVRTALLQLPRQIARVLVCLRLADRFKPSSDDLKALYDIAKDLEAALTVFSNCSSHARPPIAITVLSLDNGAVAFALLKLVAAVTRLPAPTGSSSRASSSSSNTLAQYWRQNLEAVGFRGCELAQQCLHADDATNTTQLRFARALVRMETFQACAVQLATWLEAPQTSEDGLRQGFRLADQTFMLLNGACQYAHLHLPVSSDKSPPSPYLLELAEALKGSRVLEQTARMALWALHVTAGKQARKQFAAVRRGVVEGVAECYKYLTWNMLVPTKRPSAAVLKLAEAASGPCADFVVMALGVTALCAADGGPSYGLPRGVLACIPKLVFPGQAAGEAVSFPPGALAAAAWQSARAGRLGRRAAALAMCRMGLASVQMPQQAAASASGAGRQGASTASTATAQGGQTGAGTGPATQVEAWMFAVSCLAAIRDLLEGHPGKWRAVAAEWWKLALALCGAVEGAEVGKNSWSWLAQLGRLMVEALHQPDPMTLPPAPAPPDMATALQAGLLSTLHRLIRRAVANPEGLEAAILSGMREALGGTATGANSSVAAFEGFLAPLLAHGDPLQAAELRATVGRAVTVRLLRSRSARCNCCGDRVGASGSSTGNTVGRGGAAGGASGSVAPGGMTGARGSGRQVGLTGRGSRAKGARVG